MRLAVFTGADRVSLRLLLGRTGLLGRFEVTTGGDEVANAKPAPDGILLTCERLGVDPARAAYVGDSRPDMEAARAPREPWPWAPRGGTSGSARTPPT